MLLVITSSYILCAIGYAVTGILYTKRKENPFMGDEDSTHSTLEDSVWGNDDY